MSNLRVIPLSSHQFGANITGVRLGELTDSEFSTIQSAFLTYGFLVFPDQFLTDEENIEFGQRFGKLEFGAAQIANQKRLDDGSYSEVYSLNTKRMRTNVGNEAWHTDSTYWPLSSKCAMLSAVKVTATGGETELADMRAGYRTLDDATKARIATMSAYHSTQFSQANDIGDFPPTEAGTIYHGEAYLRPLVKTHPETGKKNLFIGRHAFGIPGLSRTESRKLLKDLLEHVVSDEARVYTHHWKVGDTLLWDNRALLHRARPYDYSKPRVMTATRVAGDPESELAYYPDNPAAAAGREALREELRWLKQRAGKPD